jgi:ATP-dependent DNA ligase
MHAPAGGGDRWLATVDGIRTGSGLLLVGYYRDGKLHYAGKVGTGFSQKLGRDLITLLEKHRRPDSPFGHRAPRLGGDWLFRKRGRAGYLAGGWQARRCANRLCFSCISAL